MTYNSPKSGARLSNSSTDLPTFLENNVYYTPKAPILPLLDAFTVDLDRSKKSAVLWVLRITVSQSLRGSVGGNLKIFGIVTRLEEQLLEDPPLEKITKLATSQAAAGPRVQVRYSSFRKASPRICSGTFRKGGARIRRGVITADVPVFCLEIPLLVFRAHPYQEHI